MRIPVIENKMAWKSLAPETKDIHQHYHYLVYGRKICSNVPLPELARASFRERHIAFRSIPTNGTGGLLHQPARLLTRRNTNLGCDLGVYETEQGFLLRWESQCDFYIGREGHEILCQAVAGTGRRWMAATLYGMVLSFALHLQGTGNLHASAVVLPGCAVGFLAEPGTGKSTLAALFAGHGYPFLTDDILALERDGPGYLAHPGFPFVSLSVASVDGILGPSGPSPCVPLNQEKQRIAIDGKWAHFYQKAALLGGLFVLRRGPEGSGVEMQRLTRVEAIGSLLENTNCLPLLNVEAVRRQMAFVTDLVAAVPVWRLTYPTGFQHTPKIIEKVLEQMEASRGSVR